MAQRSKALYLCVRGVTTDHVLGQGVGLVTEHLPLAQYYANMERLSATQNYGERPEILIHPKLEELFIGHLFPME